MKLFLIEVLHKAEVDYDSARAVVVRATDEAAARQLIADSHFVGDNRHRFLDARYAECTALTKTGPAEVVCVDNLGA